MIKTVDTRHMKNGQIRLRWRLNAKAIEIVNRAITLSRLKNKNSALEAICLQYLTTGCPKYDQDSKTVDQGGERLLVRLFRDQYEVVRQALDCSNDYFTNDTDSLVNICRAFINQNKEN